MKTLNLLALLTLVSCSGLALKPSGIATPNGKPECSWSRPFTPCYSKNQVRPLWTACGEGYRDLGTIPGQGIHCVPVNQPIQTVRSVKGL